MRAWSLAWNAAEVPLTGTRARVIQVRRTGKGCLSYIVGSEGEAAAIDPSVDPEVYMRIAERNGWRITKVLDTHVHADHLSRSLPLARMTGAVVFFPDQTRVSYPFQALRDGDEIRIGDATLVALHTPGHSWESTCYLLDDRALFTGDTLFLAGVGRPDLEAAPEESRRGPVPCTGPCGACSPCPGTSMCCRGTRTSQSISTISRSMPRSGRSERGSSC